MEFNNTKWHHLHIGKHDSGLNYTIEHQGTDCIITKVDSEKDLGVTIDKNLNFREHISNKINIANRNVGIIFRTFTYLDPEMFKNLYKSLVKPDLEYATVIWAPMYKKDKIAIENVQRRATKLVRSWKDLPYPERLRKLQPLSLEFAVWAFASHKKTMCSEDLSFFSCCPQRHLGWLICWFEWQLQTKWPLKTANSSEIFNFLCGIFAM